MSPRKPIILIVDDEASIREVLSLSLEDKYDIRQAENVKQALVLLAKESISVVISDVRMPDEDGLSLLKTLQQNTPHIPVIMMTAYGAALDAVEAMKLGAYDYLIKPFQLDILYLTLQKALEKYNAFQESLESALPNIEAVFEDKGFIGKSEAIQHLWQLIPRIAGTRASILIFGEGGTGKSLLSSLIHQYSDRRDAPFITLHCASIPEGMLESMLLGNQALIKPSSTNDLFTIQNQPLVLQAQHGTLLLEDISALSLSQQATLFRILQEQKFKPNTHQEQNLNIRLISTSNQSLRQRVKEGLFREDLFFFLNVIPIYLQPLRERKNDIPLLCSFLIKKYNQSLQRQISRLDQAAISYLQGLEYIGNIRELENIIERAIALSETNTLSLLSFQVPFYPNEDYPFSTDPTSTRHTSLNDSQPSIYNAIKQESLAPAALSSQQSLFQALTHILYTIKEEGPWPLEELIQSIENQILKHALIHSHNRTDAAKKLKISFRSLRYRLQKNGFDIDGDKEDQEDEPEGIKK